MDMYPFSNFIFRIFQIANGAAMIVVFVDLLSVMTAAEEKITDGRLAKRGEFPFAVAIRGPANCGGSLIKAKKILTAGHCLFDQITKTPIDMIKYYVIGGTIDITDEYDPGRQRRDILNVKAHHEYRRKNDGTKTNDIGIVVVTYPFILGETLALATFPARNEKDFLKAWDDLVDSGKTCAGIGWGRTSKNLTVPKSNILKVAVIVPWPRSECATWYWKNDTDMSKKEVCAGGIIDSEGVCYGDSGGALVCLGHVYALVKSGPCGENTKRPTFYSLVGPYLSFLASSHLTVNKWLLSSLFSGTIILN